MSLRNITAPIENQAYLALLYSYLRQSYKALHAIDKMLDASTRQHNDTDELEQLESEWLSTHNYLETYCANMPDSIEDNRRVAQHTGLRIHHLLRRLRAARMNFMRTTLRIGIERPQSNNN